MALSWDIFTSKGSEIFANWGKRVGLSVCVFACAVCAATQRVRYSISILSFHQYTNSFCEDMYDAETIMIKQKIQKTNTEHLKSLKWEQRENLFFFPT